MQSELTGYRLSPQQRQLWLATPEPAHALARCTVDVPAAATAADLRQALERIVAAQEILRTTYVTPAGARLPLQVVHESLPIAWSEDGAPDDGPFDLERGPVVRASLADGRLTVTVPALAADRTTLAVLARALTGAAEADESLQYADYCQWQSDLGESDEDEAVEGRAFWQRPGAPAVDLPLERPAHGAPGVHSATLDAPADTEPAVLLAAWQALLYRMTQQSDFALDYAVPGRAFDELAGAYGRFRRTLPLSASVDGAAPFSALVARAADAAAQAERFQDFAPVVNEPLPGVVFEIETDAVDGRVDHGDLSLSLTCRRGESGWRLTVAADARRFDPETASRYARSLSALLAHAAAAPETPVDALEVLDDSQKAQLTRAWNDTAAEYPRDARLHTLFEAQAARTPDAPALVGADASYTYRQLNAAANRLAHRLIGAGVRPGGAVGLLVERSAAMVVGLLGILKAGAAYVPLAHDVPSARAAHQLDQTGARVAVTQSSLTGALSEWSGTALRLDADPALAEQPDTDPQTAGSPDDLVYVIYTSGSTGLPKGVANTHRGLVNYAVCLAQKLGPTEGLQFASVSPLSADLGNTCVFPCLIGGGTLHILSYDTGLNSGLFAAYAQRHAIDVLKITPSHLSALIGSPGGAGVLPRRWLVLGGEASSWELIARIRQAGACRILNHYGPTETTIGSLTFPVPDAPLPTATVPIGRPIANTRVYVVDARRQLVPVGVPGELLIGGDGLANGYVGQPELTAERFLPDPFVDGQKVYTTGDLVRWLPDGAIEFLGRSDDQVKIRGFRVEPGEIEGVLRRHSGIRDAVVVARDEGGEKRLVGYFVASELGAPTVDVLKAHLLVTLPDYMVPWQLVRLPALPLNANGKVDRQALPAPEAALANTARERPGPRNPIEEELVAIFREVLGDDEIGVNEDFFDLGGHSLMAIQVMSRVLETFQIDLAMNALFDAPTVESLARVVSEQQDADLNALLAAMDDLSDEEAEALLAREQGRR